MKLIIGNKNYSSWSLRPWLLMHQAGIAFEEQTVPLYTGDYKRTLLALSPAGQVPILQDGEVTVWDSLAICEYIAERRPDLWPRSTETRALARAICAEMHTGFAAMRTALPMNIRRKGEPLALTDEIRANVARVGEIWRACRQKHNGRGPYLFGTFGVADAMFAPVATRFKVYGVDVGEVERAYIETIYALPAMQAWIAVATAETEVLAQYER